MKVYFLKVFLFYFVFFSQTAFAQDCERKQILNQYLKVMDTFSVQSSQIKMILQGKKVERFTPQVIFGHDFSIDQTAEKITKLERLKKDKNGIAIEHEETLKCLIQLREKKKAASFIASSKELTNLKIKLLQQNKKLGDSLRQSDISSNNFPALLEIVLKDTSQAHTEVNKLDAKLIEDMAKVDKIESALDRERQSYLNELLRLKIELYELKLKANNNLVQKLTQFEDFDQKLMKLTAEINSKDHDLIEKNFLAVEKLWLTLASENYYDSLWKQDSLKLPKIPITPDKIKNKDVDKQYEDLINLRKKIVTTYTERKTEEIKFLNQLVSSSNTVRASYYKVLGHTYFFTSFFKWDTYQIYKNELLAAPFRVLSYFYKKYLYIKEQVSLGKEGYVRLFSHSLIFGFLIILFYTLKFVFQRGSSKIDSVFRRVFTRFSNFFLLQRLYSVWVKLKESTIPLLWLLTLEAFKSISYFDDFSLLVAGVQIYISSMILQNFVMIFLGAVSRLDTGNFLEFKKKALETSTRFKNIYLFYFYALIFIEMAVGRAYLYTFVYYIVLLYTLIQIAKESSRWEGELNRYAERRFSGAIVEKHHRFVSFLPKGIRAISMLAFILCFIVFDILITLTENFEISKKISANLFKKQIEKIEAEDGADTKIPVEYKEFFSPHSISTDEEYVESAGNLEEKVAIELNEWITDKSEEHSLVLFGDKGIGKTTLLKRIGRDTSDRHDVNVHYCKVPSKVTSKADLYKFIQSIFKDESEQFDIYKIDKKLEKKTVLILDETQNSFMSYTGGFDAYYALMNLINMNTSNIYWVMSFNKYSWLYLDRAFGRTKFVRSVYEVSGWSDTKIKELIMKRHAKSDYRLSYDLLINATRSQDEIDKYASVESKFFKLLWELSRGNPRSALFLWKSALSRKSRQVFNVNIPKGKDLDGMEKQPEDLLFVIACVLRHENLLASEIEKVTNLSRGLVRNALKIGLENNYFYRDERSRYMVDISTQYGLIKYLRLKNFIYGN